MKLLCKSFLVRSEVELEVELLAQQKLKLNWNEKLFHQNWTGLLFSRREVKISMTLIGICIVMY